MEELRWIFDLLLELIAIGFALLAVFFGAGFYDIAARRYKPGVPLADYRWAGFGCICCGAITWTLWLISIHESPWTALAVAVIAFVIAIYGTPVPGDRTWDEVVKTLEESELIGKEDMGSSGIKLAFSQLSLEYRETNYRVPGSHNGDFCREEVLIFTFNKTHYHIKFEDDEVAQLKINHKKVSGAVLKGWNSTQLAQMHKILEVARRACRPLRT